MLRNKHGESELIPIGQAAYVEDLSLVLGCRVGVFPTSYSGLPPRSFFQINEGVGCGDGEISKKICFVDETVSFQRSETYFDQEHIIKSFHLFYVFFCHSKEGEPLIGIDSKRLFFFYFFFFFFGGGSWGEAREKASFS